MTTELVRVDSDRMTGEWVVRALRAEFECDKMRALLDRARELADGLDEEAASAERRAHGAASNRDWPLCRELGNDARLQRGLASRVRVVLRG
jgi:hypothetical protein